MRQISDIEKEIIENCRCGNMKEFEKLVGHASPFVFSLAFRLTGNNSDAEDVVQETMITMWGKLGKIKEADNFFPWLYRITVNKCNDRFRIQKRNPEIKFDESGWTLINNRLITDPVMNIENEEIGRMIALLTDCLSPKQKTVFVLCDIEEMSYDEISFITGMNKSNIKANLHYARKKIGELIEKHL